MLGHILFRILITNTLFSLCKFDTVVAVVLSIETRTFQNLFFCNLSLLELRTNRTIQKCPSVFPVSHSIQSFLNAEDQQMVLVFFCASVIQFGCDLGSVINTDSCVVFLDVIVYNATISEYVILCKHQALYVCHFISHKQNSATLIAGRIRNIHKGFLKPTIWNVFPHVENEAFEYQRAYIRNNAL